MKFIIFAALFAVAAAAYIKTPVSSEETTSDELDSSEKTQYQAAYSPVGYSTTTAQPDADENEDDESASNDDAENKINHPSSAYVTPSYTAPFSPTYKPNTYPTY